MRVVIHKPEPLPPPPEPTFDLLGLSVGETQLLLALVGNTRTTDANECFGAKTTPLWDALTCALHSAGVKRTVVRPTGGATGSAFGFERRR